MLPRAQSLPGFKGVIFLLDEKGSKGMAIALGFPVEGSFRIENRCWWAERGA